MSNPEPIRCTAFEGCRRIASGLVPAVASKVKQVLDSGQGQPVLIFDDSSAELVEIDLRGTVDEVVQRMQASAASDESAVEAAVAPRRPGRPKLGVVAREVTLLPRHWDWLNRQPGGASVALRKLVDEARRTSGPKEVVSRSREVAYKFMVALGGDLPGFEEATRALFAGNSVRFDECLALWPADVRAHTQRLARQSFDPQAQEA